MQSVTKAISAVGNNSHWVD